jgi:uridine phosphorylase
MIKPDDVKNSTIAAGVNPKALAVPEAVIITFNQPIIGELTRLCSLKDWDWVARNYTPYSTPRTCLKGEFDDLELAVFIPPMGASPLAAFCDELVVYGARTIFLLCASWSLGDEYLRKGQIQVPDYAVGLDGTSYHYGNTGYRIAAEPESFKALTSILNKGGVEWKQGGVGCCEAIYRITREMMEDYQNQGCLSMENGEVAALYSIARSRGIHAGVLLQPYIDLQHGLDCDYVGEEYENTCRLQARIAIKTIKRIRSTDR